MADSVDRVFVHALNTVKKIPKTGATRPPPSDRMRLYGLYKQAMEGDVDGVMERPSASSVAAAAGSSTGIAPEEVAREQDKWDAWNIQKGLSRTEAKRRYIEALIETMHKYATTPNAVDLVEELEFVWNQIKGSSQAHSQHTGGSSSSGSPKREEARRFAQPMSGTDGPMKVLSPMSEQDESEMRIAEEDEAEQEMIEGSEGQYVRKGGKWSKKMERAIVRLSAEIAALREQITTGREWRSRKERSFGAWIGWGLWIITKHITVDLVVLAIILLWMRRRKDRRLEDYVRGTLRVLREYARMILPSR
ncbi:acyl-CoA binding protein [Thozetella sp. PMI_491]|nr:acyl-CoA binding protein [Thozetella sp. PMI_491]